MAKRLAVTSTDLSSRMSSNEYNESNEIAPWLIASNNLSYNAMSGQKVESVLVAGKPN